MKALRSLFISCLFLQLGCSLHPKKIIERTEVTNKTLAISTSEPLASQVAADIFKQGGNIVDAAVAASFVVSVIRPQSTGIGGGGFLLYYNARQKRTLALDFREVAPIKATTEMYLKDGKVIEDLPTTGAKAVAVPGLIAGLYDFHHRYGKLKWAKVVAPSAVIAESQISVSKHMSDRLILEKEDLEHSSELKALFFKEGRLLREGETFSNPDLAKTLRKIGKFGKDYFYKGEFAEKLVDWMKKNNGLITEEDLSSYRVKMRTPIQSKYREFSITSFPPPSSGGIGLIQILKIYDLISDSFRKQYGTRVMEIEAMKRAFIDRAFLLGDPDFVKIPVHDLLSNQYLKSRADEISNKKILPSAEILPWSKEKRNHETTHLSFIDGEGNAISTTQTVNVYFGAKVVIPGTGVILNDTMDDFSIQPGVKNHFELVGGRRNRIQPGKRPVSSMTPTLVFDAQNRVKLVAGAPGGSQIITQVYHVLSRILREKETPESAIESCRFHHQWVPDKVVIEPDCFKSFKPLEKIYTLQKAKTPFYDVLVVGREPDGKLFSVIDPRGHGKPVIAHRAQIFN
ncbi:MAG: hypothetical protein JWQ35_147 [Bacteriovoracaceae bacterium]|nr:hypothetical protein [Bacteriovoracaceae bacterium]